MELANGYPDEENIEKSNRVRKLVAQRDWTKAKNLSKELANYLKNKYPRNFRARFYDIDKLQIPEKQKDSLIKFFLHPSNPDEEQINLYKMMVKGLKIEPYNLIILKKIKGRYEYQIWIFVDETGPRSPKYNVKIENIEETPYPGGTLAPDEWYNFLEKMGVSTFEACYLYGTKISYAHNTDKWPHVVNNMKKL